MRVFFPHPEWNQFSDEFATDIGVQKPGVYTFSPVISPSGELVAVLASPKMELDLFVLSLPEDSPSALLLNRTEKTGHWLELDLRSGFTGASTLGTQIEVMAEGRVQHFQVISGGSYLSSSATPTHIGLGEAVSDGL